MAGAPPNRHRHRDGVGRPGAIRALVPLYFYDGKYTTEPKPGAQPIARMWRSPTALLALDWEAAAESFSQ